MHKSIEAFCAMTATKSFMDDGGEQSWKFSCPYLNRYTLTDEKRQVGTVALHDPRRSICTVHIQRYPENKTNGIVSPCLQTVESNDQRHGLEMLYTPSRVGEFLVSLQKLRPIWHEAE